MNKLVCFLASSTVIMATEFFNLSQVHLLSCRPKRLAGYETSPSTPSFDPSSIFHFRQKLIIPLHILIFTNSSHLTATKSETRDSSYILDPFSHLWHLCGIYHKSLPPEKNTPSLHPPAANWVLCRYRRISVLPSIVTTLIQTFLIVHQSCYNIFPKSMNTHFTFIQFMLHATALEGF